MNGRLILQRCLFGWLALSGVFAQRLVADDSVSLSKESELAALAGVQVMKELPILVVGRNGEPVAGAKVRPWALRSSQGHGLWQDDEYDYTEVVPQTETTAGDGMVIVKYPLFRNIAEGIKTTSVSVFVDHPEFASPDAIHIDVPLGDDKPQKVELTKGVPLTLRPMIDGKPTDTENLFVISSDERAWKGGAGARAIEGGLIQLPPQNLGANSFMVVRLEGDHATHFSRLTDLDVTPDMKTMIDVPLIEASTLAGKLSDDVPRPVQQGRVVFMTLPPAGADGNRVSWYTWRPIQEDGTFRIDGWPAGETIQAIALVDGYIGKPGSAPEEAENIRDPDPYYRPQTFHAGETIEIAMASMVDWTITAVDEDDEPVAGVRVASWPNVGWFNWGSQIYAGRLYRSEVGARHQKYEEEQAYAPPFQGTTDSKGKLVLSLPEGKQSLAALSDVYELPIFLGRRDVKIESNLEPSLNQVSLRLQPSGTEKLGEWDKLAGVVFGCSTREGRRICALPEVRAKFDEFTKRFRDGKNQQDPKLLAEAYAMVADAFTDVGDLEESLKWNRKAAEQQAKVTSSESQ